VQDLALTAVVVLAIAIFGGPATYLLARPRPRGRSLFWLQRVLVVTLGVASLLMGFTLIIAHVSLLIRALGAFGAVSAVAGIYRLFRGRILRSRRY
jgi:ABC-type glycerol-3-phosphate transport system permease component